MPKYGESRVMSQSFRPPSSHSRTLLETSGWSLPSWVHSRRNSTQRGSESLKKKWSDFLSTGFAPVSAEYGFFRSVGA
jgi:hypothetical protein